MIRTDVLPDSGKPGEEELARVFIEGNDGSAISPATLLCASKCDIICE
jgi:hypothetical protein